MKPIYEMTPEEKLWAKVLLQWLIDAIDGPMSYQPSEFYMTEYESRRDAGNMIRDLHPDFATVCEYVDADPVAIRDRLLSGVVDRQEVIDLFTSINR